MISLPDRGTSVHLGKYYFRERRRSEASPIELGTRSTYEAAYGPEFFAVNPIEGLLLQPGETVLAHSESYYGVPEGCRARFSPDSTPGMLVGGFSFEGTARPTLALTNLCRHHPLRVPAGLKLGSLVLEGTAKGEPGLEEEFIEQWSPGVILPGRGKNSIKEADLGEEEKAEGTAKKKKKKSFEFPEPPRDLRGRAQMSMIQQ